MKLQDELEIMENDLDVSMDKTIVWKMLLQELQVDIHNLRLMYEPDYLEVTDKEKEEARINISRKSEKLLNDIYCEFEFLHSNAQWISDIEYDDTFPQRKTYDEVVAAI